MKYIVLDLEATCWEKKGKQRKSEIIEIGAVAIDEVGNSVGEFSAFVKPLRHPELSDFCKSLTSIKQEDVDTAKVFPEVLQDFQDWIEIGSASYYLCSWGFYDKKKFEEDCFMHQQDISWLKPHMSVKHQYQKIKDLRRACGMAKALEMEGMQLEGTHHRGIDDARNISRIFKKYLKQWNLH